MIETVDYPKPWPVFWAAGAAALGYLIGRLAQRWRGWARGMSPPAAPRGPRWRVAGIWLVEVFAQRQLLRISPLRWAAHLGIFWGFLALGLLSTLHVGLRLLDRLPFGAAVADWFLRGDGRAALKAWGNFFGLLLLAGLLLGLTRRLIPREAPGPGSSENDTPLLVVLLLMTLSGFLLEGLRAAAGAAPGAAAALRPWLTALWSIHGFGGVAFVAALPHSKLMHGLLAPLVIALNARAEHARKDLSWPRPAQQTAPGSPKA